MIQIYNKNQIKTEIRNFKLKVLDDTIKFEIKTDKYKSELKFIKREFPNDIITGSFVLLLYGLIDREFNDIDILIKDKDRYSDYDKNSNIDYGGNIIESNRLGYRNIFYKENIFCGAKKYKVDFFQDLGSTYTEYNGIKIHNPMEIIDYKVTRVLNDIDSHKHNKDLFSIFGGNVILQFK